MKIVAIGDARSAHVMRYLNYFASRGHEMHLISYDEPIEKYISPRDWVQSVGKVGERIFIPSKKDEDGRQSIGTNPTIHVVGSDHLFLKFFWRDRKVRKIIRSIQPDVIHAHFVTKYGFHIRKGEIPTIITAWGDDILVLPEQSGMIKSRTAKALKAADHIYTVSQNIKDRIMSDYDMDGSNITVNPGGIDLEEFNPGRFKNTERDSEDTDIILFCNRGFNPVYDIPTLVKAFRAARSQVPNLTLYLAGSEQIGGGEKSKIVEGDGLYILGQIKPEEMPNYLTAADIFISTATSDGTPISMLEAMAMKKPCIMTAVGGVTEWIVDGWNGILVPPGDVKSITDAILRLASTSPGFPVTSRPKQVSFTMAWGATIPHHPWELVPARIPDSVLTLGENARTTVELRGNFYKNMGEIEQRYKDMVFKKGQPQPWRKKKEEVKEPEVEKKEEKVEPPFKPYLDVEEEIPGKVIVEDKKTLVEMVLESGVKTTDIEDEEDTFGPVERVKAQLVTSDASDVFDVPQPDDVAFFPDKTPISHPDKGDYADFIAKKIGGMSPPEVKAEKPAEQIRVVGHTELADAIRESIIQLAKRAALAEADDAMKFMVAAHQGIESLIMLEDEGEETI